MNAKHARHDVLTRDEQRRRSERALDAQSYRRRAATRMADDAAAAAALDSLDTLPRAGADNPARHTPRDPDRANAAVRHASNDGRRGRRHVHAWRRVLVGLGIACAVLVGCALAFAASVDARLASGIDASLYASLTPQQGGTPFYMLLLGVDRSEEREASGSEDIYRADTIILARIDAANRTVTLVSIPRDTQVDLGENGTQKINAAYALGGGASITRVVSRLAGVPIAHYAEIDFDGFSSVVDQIGGVDVTLPVDVVDPAYTGLSLAAGDHHLDGYTALMLVRSRHAYDAYGAGDYYRAANQRAVIGAIARGVLARGPLALPGTISALADHVTTDMGVADIVGLAVAMRGFDVTSDLRTAQAPTESAYEDGVWYELLDSAAWSAMMARIDAGETPYADGGADPTAGIAATATGDAVITATIEPEYAGTVAVLNATDTQGLAAGAVATLQTRGFEASAANAGSVAETSSVTYNGDDALAKALAVANTLGIVTEPRQNDGTLPTDANVVVVLGADAA